MTLSEVVTKLNDEGIQATVGQLRYAVKMGYIVVPRRLGSRVLDFDGRTMRSVRSYFLKRKRGRKELP